MDSGAGATSNALQQTERKMTQQIRKPATGTATTKSYKSNLQ